MAEDTPRERNTPVQLHGKEIVLTNQEEAPTFYANNLLLQSSVWDVRLAFGLLTGATDETLIVRSMVNIILSPQHAKAVSDILRKQVEHYEAAYGPIPSDPRASAALDTSEE